jgi:hypothetical protein
LMRHFHELARRERSKAPRWHLLQRRLRFEHRGWERRRAELRSPRSEGHWRVGRRAPPPARLTH